MEAKITKLKDYIKKNPIAILSTVSDSQPHGSAVYVCVDGKSSVYFTTKENTRKFQFLQSNPKVALTIVKPSDNSTLQAEGAASVLKDEKTLAKVFNELAKIYAKKYPIGCLR